MRTFLLAAAVTALVTGAAAAQEAPYTVRHGQVKYPGQIQGNAPFGDGYAMSYYGDPYYGGASIAPPALGFYDPVVGPYYDGPRYAMRPHYDDPDYNEHGRGAFIFDRAVINSDQNYSGR